MTDNPMKIFEDNKRVTASQLEYWSARQLAKILEYTDYRNFEIVLKKAQESCKNSDQSIKYHFVDVTDMIEIGKTASREISDMMLSRYACYLVMQNADPSKEIVALGQTYFAIQTRKQEVLEQRVEDSKRLLFREEITAHNKHLAETAAHAGVKNYAAFTNHGYKGLYGGFTSQDIQRMRKLKKSQKILDYMGSEELAANLFRATQADAKLKRENIQGEVRANQMHFEVGKKVRKTIREIGGTMPEKLPVVDGITEVKQRMKNYNKNKALLAKHIK